MKKQSTAVKVQSAKNKTVIPDKNITVWNDKPTLVLNPESRFPFQFQIAKAKMILANIELIKAFVDMHGE